MSESKDNGAQPFTLRDADAILAVMENQPLQNMAAARQLSALQDRFRAFCAEHLTPAAPVAAKGPSRKPTNKTPGPDPLE